MKEEVKNLPAMQEPEKTQVRSLSREDPLEEGVATHSIFLPGESHGQRSLARYSPWGHIELDTTKQLSKDTLRHAQTFWAYRVVERQRMHLSMQKT